MRFLRKLQNVSPNGKKFLTISIPTQFTELFSGTDTAIIEELPGGRWLVVLPAMVKPME